MFFPKQIVKKTARALGYNIVPLGSVRDDGYLDKSEFQYILWLDRIYQKIARVPGNIIEVGVARGRNSILLGRLIELSGERAVRRYYGFDTFEGYAERDLQENGNLRPDAWKDIGFDFVSRRIEDAGLGSISFLIKGDVRQTAPQFISTGGVNFQPNHLKIALLYIDCNAFDPALFSMKFFHRFMSDGGVICIDEKRQGGESRALDQFCADEGLVVTRDPGPFGIPAYAVVKRNS